MEMAATLAILEQQRLYLMSGLSRTRIIIDGIHAKLVSVEQTLHSPEKLQRAKKKKLQHTRWRVKTTLRNCENEQHALFQNLGACEERIWQLQAAALSAQTYCNAQWGMGYTSPMQSWFPNQAVDPVWVEQAQQLARPVAPVSAQVANLSLTDSYDGTWQWPSTKWSDETRTSHAQLYPYVSIDPHDVGSPGPIECVDDTGLTHYIYTNRGSGSGSTNRDEVVGKRQSLEVFRPTPNALVLDPETRGSVPMYSPNAVLGAISRYPAEPWTCASTGDMAVTNGAVSHAGVQATLPHPSSTTARASDAVETDGKAASADDTEEPKRRYSAAAVDLLLYRFSQPGPKAKKYNKGHRKTRSSVGNINVSAILGGGPADQRAKALREEDEDVVAGQGQGQTVPPVSA